MNAGWIEPPNESGAVTIADREGGRLPGAWDQFRRKDNLTCRQ